MAIDKKWKPVNIDQVLGKARNRIYRLGIELEGGWDRLPTGTNLVHDGSVQFPNGGIPHVGEMTSPILDTSAWQAWIKKNYPQHVNQTCGMHVHLSFKTALTYQRLMVPEYPATIIAYFTRWAKARLPVDHCIVGRLAGKSTYCQHKFWPDEQAMSREKGHNRDHNGHRYTVINYCYARQSTLECRLLPMMPDVNVAEDAIQHLLDITNAFLVVTAKREERHSISHTDEEGIERSVSQIRV